MPTHDERDQVFENFFYFLKELMAAPIGKVNRNDKRLYASTLVNNVRRQSFLVHYLMHQEESRIDFIEIATVQSIGRMALETYLVFYHIFIDSESESEQDFKYYAWILEALIRRVTDYDIEHFRHLADDPEGAEEIDHAQKVIDANPMQQKEIRDLLGANTFYQELLKSDDEDRKKRYRDRVKNGWFPDNWTPLMKAAKFNYFVENNIYNWFSAAAHPSFSIIETCTHARTYEEQLGMCQFTKSLTMTLLARLCLDFPKVFPEAQPILDARPDIKLLAEEVLKKIEENRSPSSS